MINIQHRIGRRLGQARIEVDPDDGVKVNSLKLGDPLPLIAVRAAREK